MVLPQGYTYEIVHEEKDDASMRWTLIAAAVCVFLLLAMLFEDLATPICVMATFPLAIIGVLWGLVITKTSFADNMVWVGMIMLVGIVVNDAILTLGQTRVLRKKGYALTRAVIEGGRNRLRPIIMTTATTILAMLPLAIREGGESEIWPAFAITVIFGLLASTFFTLVFIPAIYLSLKDISAWLMSVGLLGLGVALGTTVSLVYFGFLRASWVESLAWRIVLAPTAFFAAVALISMAIRAVTVVRHVNVFEGEEVHLSIRNLTKTYGADVPFVRDWKVKRRREAGLRERGESRVNARHLYEDLVWKVLAYGLIGYSHYYFDNRFWLFVTACASWAALYDLIRTIGMLVEGEAFLDLDLLPSRWRRVLWRCVLRSPTLALAYYFYWRLEAQLWLTILFVVVVWTLQGLREVAVQARRDGVEQGQGKGLRAQVRRLALRIPLIAGVKPQVHALSQVNLEIGKGMFGLLGPNGAGKTTLMRMLCNIYEPTCGCIEINGRNTRRFRNDVQPIIGYLPQHFGMYQHFSVWEYLSYFALLNEIFETDERNALVEKVIEEVHLGDRKHDKIGSLSGGMKQRVGIAQTLLHLPKIIVVDEPTAGLDPLERIRLRNLLAELGRDRIVVLSTHIIEDVMSACHDLAVLNGGRLVFRGSPQELLSTADGRVREALFDAADLGGLAEQANVISQVAEDQGIRVRFVVGERENKLGETVEPTLEDAYVNLLQTQRVEA